MTSTEQLPDFRHIVSAVAKTIDALHGRLVTVIPTHIAEDFTFGIVGWRHTDTNAPVTHLFRFEPNNSKAILETGDYRPGLELTDPQLIAAAQLRANDWLDSSDTNILDLWRQVTNHPEYAFGTMFLNSDFVTTPTDDAMSNTRRIEDRLTEEAWDIAEDFGFPEPRRD